MDDAPLFDALPEAAVARALLPYLRQSVGAPDLSLVALPRRLLGGFDSLIYAFELRAAPAPLDGPLVLRLYRDAGGPERARREGSVQNAVGALGFPTPLVQLTCLDRSVLGGAFVIMQRLPGRVMLDALFGPRLLRLPALLAALHARLHALDAQRLTRALAAAGCSTDALSVNGDLAAMQARIGAARLRGLESAMQWLLAHRPAPVGDAAICHGDFHPLNILLEGGRVSGVLDWAWSKVDDPAWDVGATVALITQGPLQLPRFLRGLATAGRRWVVDRYLRSYRALRPLDLDAVRYYEALRCVGMLIEAGEHVRARCGDIAPIAKPTAFDDPRTIGSLSARFRAISGVAATIGS
jgi:aminoglycoside phosphotransferase (APT) family kinase protein